MRDEVQAISLLLGYLLLFLVIWALVWDRNRRKTKGNRIVLHGIACRHCGSGGCYQKATLIHSVLATMFFPLGLLVLLTPSKFCDECEQRIK